MNKLLLFVVLLGGCCTPEVQTRVIDTGCGWTRPIFISQQDILTDETAKAILAHNNTGKVKCGWKPTIKEK